MLKIVELETMEKRAIFIEFIFSIGDQMLTEIFKYYNIDNGKTSCTF